VVRELVTQEHISLISLQESKLDVCDDRLVLEMLGPLFDYFYLPASHTCGGILLAWRKDIWSVSNPMIRDFTLTAKVVHCASGLDWWMTSVCGPQSDPEKVLFLDELRSIRTACSDQWMVCGDFNLIYKAEDKNNSRLNRRMMGCFRRFIDEAELMELHLNGRLFTWSSERDAPTLERIDRVFTSEDWSIQFPDHGLSALASECSDHAPLLLCTDCSLPHFKRFRFENFWTKCVGVPTRGLGSQLVNAACFLVPDVDARGNTVTHGFILFPATGPYVQQRGNARALYYLAPGVLVVGAQARREREGGSQVSARRGVG